MSLKKHLRAALPIDSSGTEHPALEDVGCIEAWICYQQRVERPDGSVVCDGCGRVLRSD